MNVYWVPLRVLSR